MSFGYFFQPNDLNEIKQNAREWLKKAIYKYEEHPEWIEEIKISRHRTEYCVDDGNIRPQPFDEANWLYFFVHRTIECRIFCTGDGAQGPFESWEVMNEWALESWKAFNRQGIKAVLEPVEAECLGRPNVRQRFIKSEDLEKEKLDLARTKATFRRATIR
jgi:hypothetical protein